MEAALREAELASCSVELLLPLLKNTVEGIGVEHVSVGLRMANEIESQHNIQSLDQGLKSQSNAIYRYLIPNIGVGIRILYSCH